MSYIYDLLDTWASGGGPYTSIKMNATDNDSGSASLLMDLQVSTASKFSVSKAGSATFGGSITATASGSYVNAAGLSLGTGGAGGIFVSGGNAFTVNSSGGFRWSSNANVNVDTNGDLILTRRGIANLRLGAADTTGTTAPTPQFLSAQSWSSSTTNNQTGANFTIDGSQGTGTGAGGSIIFRVAPAGGTSNGVQNALAAALTITSTGAATFSSTVTSGGNFVMPVAASIGNSSGNQLAIGSGNIYPSSNPLSLGTFAVPFSFLALGTGSNAALLTADAANTLALRNGTAAQRFNVYNTWTSSTNYEAFKIDWITTANTVLVGTEKGSGGGTARALEFQTDGTTRLTIASNGSTTLAGFTIVSGGSIRLANSDGDITYSSGCVYIPATTRFAIGGVTSSFPALKRNSTALETKLADDSAYAPHAMQYLDVTDGVTAPASATGRARIYVDTADGDLKVIFADGTVKTIVTDT